MGKNEELTPSFQILNVEMPLLPDLPASQLNIRYPLIAPYVNVHIYFDAAINELLYDVEEPALTEQERSMLSLIEDGIEELINLSVLNVKNADAVISYLEKNIKVILDELGMKISQETFVKIMYYVYRDFVGLNEIEPLMKDYFIEDVECNGVDTPLYIVHRKYGNIKTNVIFKDARYLESFVEKLAQKCGKYVSYAKPLLDAQMPDGSRANATFSQDISARGPSFSIRKFTKEPFTPVKLMQMNTVSPEVLAYLWMLIEHEANIMIIGATGSGKTSFINSLAFFIPPQARIVSIEDTRELNLLHENWLPSVAREGYGINEGSEIDLFTLLKESFRQRPDYVVVGEIRGKEAYVLFQGAASISGNEKVIVLNGDHPRRIPIKDLKDNVNYKAISIDPINNKVEIFPVKFKVKHEKRKRLYRIFTKSGRKIVVTPDHSVFSYENGKMVPMRADELKDGSNIVIPAKIPCGYADISYLKLIDELKDIRVYAPILIREAVKRLGYDKCCKIAKVKSISDYYANFTDNEASALKAKSFIRLMENAGINYDLGDLKVRLKYSDKVNPNIDLNEEFLKLIGYYLSEGSLNESGRNSYIALYNKDDGVLNDMRRCIEKVVGRKPRERLITSGYGTCIELKFSSKILCELIKKHFGKKDKKRIADFVFGLSKEKIGYFLSALWAGDGYLSRKVFGYSTISKELANDVAQLLLVYNILCTITKKRGQTDKNKDIYELMFRTKNEKKRFLEYVKPVNKTVDLSSIREIKTKKFIGDIYVDKIKSITEINLNKGKCVYDLCVPKAQNFIGGFGGIVLHNSGHAIMSTMHAEDVQTMIRRLETQPINLSPTLVNSLDVVCSMINTKIRNQGVRRLKDVTEIIEIGNEIGSAATNMPFVWEPRTDTFFFKTESAVFEKIIRQKGISKNALEREFRIRSELLMQMYRRGIFQPKEVQDIINAYYKNPRSVIEKFNITT